MKRCAVIFVMVSASLAASAKQNGNGGGADVSVALFSTRSLHAATITPLASNAWIARCAACAHHPFTTALHVTGQAEVFAGGTLRVTGDATGDVRTSTGLWHLQAHGKQQDLDVVLTLPSERYVAAVLKAEAAPDEPAESLRALAILARTYALNGSHFAAQPGHLQAQLCDSTECQAMLLGPVSRAIEDATRDSAGETLWFGDHRAEVFFSQSCGGLTEAAGAVWPSLRDAPYLHSHPDPYCLRRDRAAWHAEVPLTLFAGIARVERWHLPENIATARVAERSKSQRALRVVFTSRSGSTSTVSASALRFGIGRALGWNRVRSDAYELGLRNGALVFDGHGHGHGVGLCQAGAAEMASEGKSAREVLAFYFPGTAVHILPGDNGWQEMRAGQLTLRGTRPFSAERRAAIEQTWIQAQKRFPSRLAISPLIIFAPTTGIFRQLTTQPGWDLASTQGNTIVLQPDAVFMAHGLNPSTTLLHEMLHILVEAESGDGAPLWLREGLIEVLAGDPGGDANPMSATAIDAALLHADSQRTSQHAHLAAAARVHALIARYGFSTVRGWLSSGVPSGVT